MGLCVIAAIGASRLRVSDGCSPRAGGGAETAGGKAPGIGGGTGRGHGDLDAAHGDPDQRPDLEELEADGAAGGVGEGGFSESDAPQCAHEYVGHRSEPQAQLVGPHGRRRGAVGVEVELTFLDAVLHVAAGAVDVLIEPSRCSFGGMLSRLTGAPLVFDFQGSLTAEMLDHHFVRAGGKREWIWRRLEGLINRLPRAILTSSRHGAQLLLSEFKVDAKRVVPLPDCVDTEFFRPRTLADQTDVDALKDQLGIPRDRTVVIYLGLLAHYQGTDHILAAARQVIDAQPQTHFLVMGYPGFEGYRTVAQQLGLGDHFTFTERIC